MPLTPGTRLGPYEITGSLGAGGMGEVYRARDTRLDRSVAIKVLPPEVSADADRRARFEREAKTIAGLSHPHICTLYDVGEATAVSPAAAPDARFPIPDPRPPSPSPLSYLVMELLAGETLAGRLEKGPLPLEQALCVATEIAEALAAAHRKGITHRDLKPANVMLTKSGAKLLDFGLAKLTGHGERPAAASLASAATEMRPLTSEGTIVGTLQYMAPEQVEGKPADARTDLWALGAILYEMLTGKRAFEGASAASLITAIMSAQPPAPATLQPVTPPALDRLVRKCLAKDPDERWQSARDVADELRWMGEGSGAGARAVNQPRRRDRSPLAWRITVAALLLAVVTATLAAVVWFRASRPTGPRAPVTFLLSDRLPTAAESDPQRLFAVSKDGQRVVFVAERDGVPLLHLRDLRALEAKVIAGTENAMEPFFSPDGQRIGFFAGGKLKVVSLAGGAPEDRAQINWPRGGTWTPDDTIIFSPSDSGGLWQVPAAGGVASLLAQPDPAKGERSYRWPDVLPAGDAVVFTLTTSDIRSFDDARVMIRSLRTGEQRELIRRGSFAAGTATGHLLFARAGALMAVPFDAARGAVTGSAKPVLNGVVTYPVSGAAQYAVSADGTLAYIAGEAVARQATLNWVDTMGRTSALATEPAAYQAVSVSPDGRSAAVDIDGANASIYLLDLVRTSMTRLTLEWSNNAPFWSPDGARACFVSERGGVSRFYCQAAGGGSVPEPVTPARPSRPAGASWAPSGLAFAELAPESGSDIWACATGDESNPRPFLQTRFNETNPRISTDERWIAYESDETGRTEVLRPAVSKAWTQVADLVRRGNAAPVGTQWTRTVLPKRGCDHGGDVRHVADVLSRTPAPAVPESHENRPALSLRHGTRRTLPDDPTAPGTGPRAADDRAELVRGTEGEGADAKVVGADERRSESVVSREATSVGDPCQSTSSVSRCRQPPVARRQPAQP